MLRVQLAFDGAPLGLDTHRIASSIEAIAFSNGSDLRATIRFVAPSEMAHLHRFKGGEGPTNVLTFVEEARADIAICLQVAREDATVRGWNVNSELSYLCIHGCLHALGFDHRDRASAAVMNRLERQILARAGLEAHALDS